MARPTCSRAMPRYSPPLPEASVLVEIEGVPDAQGLCARRGNPRPKRPACAACSSPKPPARAARSAVVTRGGADSLAGLARRQRALRAHRSDGRRQRSRFACVPDARCCGTCLMSSAWCASRSSGRPSMRCMRATTGRRWYWLRLRGIRRPRRLARQAFQLDLAPRQDPRSAGRQATAGGAVPHGHLDQPAALVAHGRGRGPRRDDRLRAR